MVQYASLLLACLIGSAAASNGAASNKQVSDDGTLHCGIFASGNKDKVSDLELELRGGQAGKSWTIGPGQCNRVHCADTTGVYVCNDGGKDLTLTGAQIAKGVKCIYDNCCRKDLDGWGHQNLGQSGQRFYSGMGLSFNIAVGYGNCRDPVNIRPSNAEGWDVNGVCMGGVMIPSFVNCP